MKKQVCIVIPVYKETLAESEIIALRQCLNVLGDYDIYLNCPQSLDLQFYQKLFAQSSKQLNVQKFNDKYFIGLTGYNHLLTSSFFYEKYLDYEYMLIYQLDSFVFKDELTYWCNKDFDYIGAPWFEGFYKTDEHSRIIKYSGNGGFSLRKIRSFHRVYSKELSFPLIFYLHYEKKGFHFLFQLIINALRYLINKHKINEDIIISYYIRKKFKNFNVAESSVSKYFAFECQPDRLYLQIGKKLPFGCHGFNKY